MIPIRLRETLGGLVASGIEFILVGGTAALMHGAPINTFDLDIVFRRDPENIARILKWLEEADAIFRIQPERRLRPNESHVSAGKHLNLITRYGWVDFLGNLGEGLEYDQLLPQSTQMQLADGVVVRVLNLDTIIALKEKLGYEKDLAALPILRATLKMIRESRS